MTANASTKDCKALLDHDERTQQEKGWKRVSKKKAYDGIERWFVSAGGMRARVLENQGALHLDSVVEAGQSIAPHTIDHDPQHVAQAQSLVDLIMMEELEADVSMDDIDQSGVAFANKCIFAISKFDDYVDDDEVCAVEVFPADFWAAHRCCMDSPLPLYNLLPGEEVDSPNESSTWLIWGINDLIELADAMLERGFVWSDDLQTTLDSSPGPEVAAAVDHLRALYQGASVAKATPKP